MQSIDIAPDSFTSILRLKDVVKRVRLGKTSIYKLVKENKFPKPLKLSDRAVGWSSEDIQRWINTRPVCSRSIGEYLLFVFMLYPLKK